MKRNPENAKRREMADGWASFCMLADPIGAWESLYTVERVSIYEPILGVFFSTVIAPFVFLADVGTSASLGAELDAIRTTAALVRRLGLSLHDPGTETAKNLDALAGNLERMRHAATMAEELLRRHGWKFDPLTGKAREVAKRRGGYLIVRLVQRLGVEGKHGNTPAGRVRIKAMLSPIFSDLDAGPHGAIARALENLGRMTKPTKR